MLQQRMGEWIKFKGSVVFVIGKPKKKKAEIVVKRRTFIYALCEPGTEAVRYIGKSNWPELRYQEHLEEKTHFPKNEWIAGLLAAGKTPGLKILDRCWDKDWEETEEYWIDVYKKKGADLLNLTGGGDCSHEY